MMQVTDRMRGLAWAVGLGLAGALTGCAAPDQFTPTASCELERVADIPAKLDHGLPMIEAAINGHAAHLVVDTGASRTVIEPESAQRFGLRGDAMRSAVSTGVGGSTVNAGFIGDTLEIGGLVLHQPTFAHGEFTGRRPGFEPDGFLGATVLSRFDVELDLPHGHIRLYRARACPTAQPPWHALGTVPLVRANSASDLYAVPVRLDGVEIYGLVDTGADAIYVSKPVASRLGVTGPVAGVDPQSEIHGFGGSVAKSYQHIFDTFELAGQGFAKPRLVVIDMNGPAADSMLIGEAFLGRRRIWLSFNTGRMIVGAP